MPRQRYSSKSLYERGRQLQTLQRSASGEAVTSVPAHDLLSLQHADTVINAVIRGALPYGNATPKWDLLAHPGAAGHALVTDATDFAWDPTPAWTGDHTWDAVAGDSPALILVGGSNDQASLHLDDAAGALVTTITDNKAVAYSILDDGDGDLYMQIVTTTGSEAVVFNNGGDNVDFRVAGAGATNALFVQGSDGFVGLGTATPDERLHLLSSVTIEPVLKIENNNDDEESGSMEFRKDSASTADGDNIGQINFRANTSTGVESRMLYIQGETLDRTNGDQAGGLSIICKIDGIDRDMLEVSGYNGVVGQGEIVINGDEQNIDFIARASGQANALIVIGSTGFVGMNVAVPGAQLSIDQSGGNVPVLKLDQGDVADPCILYSVSGVDADIVLWELEVTGGGTVPAGYWDDSGQNLNWNKGLIIDPSEAAVEADGTLHVHTASAGAVTANMLADDLIIENSTAGGMSILVPDDGSNAYIAFGNAADDISANIRFTLNTGVSAGILTVGTHIASGLLKLESGAGVTALTIDSGQNILLSATATLDLDGVVDALIFDAAGTLTLSAPTPGQLDFEIAGADDFTMTANSFNVLAGSSIVMADGTTISTAGGPVLTFDDTGNHLELTGASFFINETANANMVIGLTIDQDAEDGEAVNIRSSDVGAVNSGVETGTYLRIQKHEGSSGGVDILGLKDANGVNAGAVRIIGNLEEDASTNKTTAARAIIEVYGLQYDGANIENTVANGNVWALRTYRGGAFVTTNFMDEDGDFYYDGALTNYDHLADEEMARDIQRVLTQRQPIRYNMDAMVEAGILYPSEHGIMVSHKGMTGLSFGAHTQAYSDRRLIWDECYAARDDRLSIWDECYIARDDRRALEKRIEYLEGKLARMQ